MSPRDERHRARAAARANNRTSSDNNPLPPCWSWLFYLTVVFARAYLVLYPGLGSWRGTLGWTHACGSGRILADLVGGRRPEIEL